MVKAADGVTDLYGNMWKPFDFDPKKKYPIIANVYPGPQQEGTPNVLGLERQAAAGPAGLHRHPGRPSGRHADALQGLSQLRLQQPARLRPGGQEVRHRAAGRPALVIDINRVGIYGHSGGGFMSAAALLQKPYNEFFKVGVASSGNHDNNIYNDNWAEPYHGLKEVVINDRRQDRHAQAAKRATEDDPQDEAVDDRMPTTTRPHWKPRTKTILVKQANEAEDEEDRRKKAEAKKDDKKNDEKKADASERSRQEG